MRYLVPAHVKFNRRSRRGVGRDGNVVSATMNRDASREQACSGRVAYGIALQGRDRGGLCGRFWQRTLDGYM